MRSAADEVLEIFGKEMAERAERISIEHTLRAVLPAVIKAADPNEPPSLIASRAVDIALWSHRKLAIRGKAVDPGVPFDGK